MSKVEAVDVDGLYAASTKQPSILDVPELKFLMVDGGGDPNTSPEFQAALQVLFSLSYGIHFALKKDGVESRLRPLEALWWVPGKTALLETDKAVWRWTAMVLQPDEITPAVLEQLRAEVFRKKALPQLAEARLEPFREGLCAQIMHVGPYGAEKPTIDRLHAFITGAGYRLRGKHHEIYLGDPRRAQPEKLKTIVRQPIER
ncbi:MAG: GyrI-like domain-containing protein [Candidatus Dormibacterales bacterium]